MNLRKRGHIVEIRKHQARLWFKTISWGTITALLYAGLFIYAEAILHLAHTTPESCVVVRATQTVYFHKVDATACAGQGGHIEPGQPWHVLVPILIAFALSFAHGAFTGLFWEAMGLKPATRPAAKE